MVIILGQKGNLRIYKGKTVIYYRKNYRTDCREYPGAEMPKEINMVLISISRYDLWDQKKLVREGFSVQLKGSCLIGCKTE